MHSNVPDLPTPKQGGSELALARSTAIAESNDEVQGTPGGGSTLPSNETRGSGVTTGLPSPRCGYYKVVDDDSVVNTSVVSVTIGQGQPSFGEPYDASIGHSPDDFAWDADEGILTVQGTVFIDAMDLNITGARFAGRGTIVCSGDIHIVNQWEPVVIADYPTIHCVGLSATGPITEDVQHAYGPFFSAVSWTMLTLNAGEFDGEIIAPDITLGMHSNVRCTPNMSANLPPSMPGGGGQIVVSSGWHEGRN